MKVKRIDKETGEERIYEESLSMSKNACQNYNGDKISYREQVDFEWWGTFKHLIEDRLFDDAVEWSKENCEGLFYGNSLSGSFKFEFEEDAMAFKLRWE